ncbi:hypothetical protein [Psychroflexus lacisalsi]|nr:hypothetical protein [Psychroflexus lacisalsi]MBZ9619158.1 hypothetical protein [Psychroflexus lacisalsi]
MKKLIFLICMIPILNGCSSTNDDNDEIDCALIDIAIPSLYVKIIDSTNANLIENGTIYPDKIEVDGNFQNPSFRFIPESVSVDPEFFNTLNLFIPNATNFQYTLHLDDLETIVIDFTAERISFICDVTYYEPSKAIINNLEVELIEVKPLRYMVVVKI